MAFTSQGNPEHLHEMTPGTSETAGEEEHTMRSPWDYKMVRHWIKAAADPKESWVTSATGSGLVCENVFSSLRRATFSFSKTHFHTNVTNVRTASGL